MIARVLAWLRDRWHALAVTVGLVLVALVASWSAGRRRERIEGEARRARTIGDELRADDALDLRDAERARIEAETRARVARDARQRSTPPRTTAQAKAEAMARLERAARAADEDG